MTMRNLSFLLFAAAAVTGCAADPVDAGDDDGGGGGGGGGGDPQPVPLTPAGKFKVTSEFDLATNAPGAPGTIVNYFINATDDPDDPTKFIVDQVIAALPDGSIKNALMNAAPFVTGYLNDRLLAVAPDFVTTLVNVGDAFGQVTKHFGTLEVLEIDAQGHTTKTVNGLHFVIDSVPMDFMFADEGITETKVENVMVTLEASGKLSVANHVVPMKYGQVLKLAIDKGIIPLIDPSAQNLGDILHNVVNCQAVGQYVYEAIGFGSPSTFESACNSGLTAAGGALYTALDNLDSSALEFTLAGTARGVDRNQDGSMDEVTTGQWTGTLGYAGTPAPLGAAKFFGAKL